MFGLFNFGTDEECEHENTSTGEMWDWETELEQDPPSMTVYKWKEMWCKDCSEFLDICDPRQYEGTLEEVPVEEVPVDAEDDS